MPRDDPLVRIPTDIEVPPLAWRELGEGEAVVFLHGLGGSRIAWEPQLQALSESRRCVAWDMPGYGASEPVSPLTFTAIADALAQLLDLLGVEEADLCGLSFGGQHALHMALNHPERVSSLVLADTSPAFGLDGTTAESWLRARLDPLDAGLTPADIAERVIDSVAGPGLTQEARAQAVRAFSRISAKGLRASCECLPNHDVLSRLHEISVPTLVIAGELDQETPLAYSELLAVGIPDCRLEVIDGAGHLTPSEAPEEFNALVRRFLEDGTSLRP